jgi:hypothetical protein
VTKPAPAKLRRKVVVPDVTLLDDATIQKDIQARCPVGSPFFKYLCEIRFDDIPADKDEFTRGVAEGMRRLAKTITEMVMAEQT